MRWKKKKLGEICEIPGQYGLSVAAHNEPKGLPMLRMGNIDSGRLEWEKLKYVQLSEADIKAYELKAGDLLFNRTNSAELVGKTAVFDGAREAVFASYIVRFRLKPDEANPEFVCHYINSERGRAYIEANMARAVGQVNISASTMKRMELPVPPLPEQRRIALRLREQLAEVENARAALQSQLAAAERLYDSELRKSFGAPEGSWKSERLGNCLTLINGRAYSQHELLSKGTPVIRIQNLNGGNRWYYSNLELPDDKYCDEGDLLFAWSASFGPYIWRGPKAIFHYHIWKVMPREAINTRFAYYLLSWITESIREGSHGIAMLHMTKEGMENWKVALPSLEEQRCIAARLDRSQKPISDLIAQINDRLHGMERLPTALLREAFTNLS